MFTSRPIGFVSSPYKDAREVPMGLGAKHEADGVLRILPEFELGLTDIEGFSQRPHLQPYGAVSIVVAVRQNVCAHRHFFSR